MVRCCGVPLPVEAKLIPGSALARAISSGNDFTGSDGAVTRTSGIVEVSVIGVKSLIGS